MHTEGVRPTCPSLRSPCPQRHLLSAFLAPSKVPAAAQGPQALSQQNISLQMDSPPPPARGPAPHFLERKSCLLPNSLTLGGGCVSLQVG